MGDAAHRLATSRPRRAEREEHPQEERARAKIIAEAAEHGATLNRPDARGGLPASLVLGVHRRDGWKCLGCGTREKIGPHHQGGIPATKILSRWGHKNTVENVATLCDDCHDEIHDTARAAGQDSGQVLPEGDVGNKHRDRGDKPLARPKT